MTRKQIVARLLAQGYKVKDNAIYDARRGHGLVGTIHAEGDNGWINWIRKEWKG